MSTELAKTSNSPNVESSPQTFSLIAEAAKDSGFDAHKFEILVKLHNDEADRQDRKEAYKALATFKTDCPIIRKTKSVYDNNDRHRYNYSAMDDLMRQIGPLMRNHGLSATYSHEVIDGLHFTTCRLLHSNGYTFPESKVQINRAQSNRMTSETQVSGITQSYGERYALKAALGLTFTDEDDDGQIQDSEPQREASLDDAIDLLMSRKGKRGNELEEALFDNGVKVPEGGWRELPDKIKQRILDGWDKLFSKGGSK